MRSPNLTSSEQNLLRSSLLQHDLHYRLALIPFTSIDCPQASVSFVYAILEVVATDHEDTGKHSLESFTSLATKITSETFL